MTRALTYVLGLAVGFVAARHLGCCEHACGVTR